MDNRPIKLDISAWAVVKVLSVLVLAYLLFAIRDIIALFFVVLIFVAALNPVINLWEKRMKRLPAVILLFALIFLFFVAIIYLVVPPIVKELSQFIGQTPLLLERFGDLQQYAPQIEKNLSTITQGLSTFTEGFVSVTTGVFGGIVTVMTVLVVTAYLLLDRDGFSKFVVSVLPVEQKEQIISLFDKIGNKLGDWLRGQVLLGIIIAILDFIGLLVIGVPYAITLAVISGLLEFIPTVGPILAGLFATGIALVISPVKAIFVIVLYTVIQQLENNLIVPKVMQKAVGLSPVIIIFAILIGAKLMGILGAILAVPVAGSISVVVQEWSTIKKSLNIP